MVYLKAVQKSTPSAVSVSGTIDQKTYLKNLGGGASAPLAPHLDPPMASTKFHKKQRCQSHVSKRTKQ